MTMKKTIWFALLTVAVAAFGWRATAQGGLTVTFPSVLAAGSDYATDVLGDPWDMNSLGDISIDPGQRQFWTNLAAVNDSANGAPTAVGGAWNGAEGLTFLYQGHYAVINNVRNGRRFPIDTTLYKQLSFKMRQSAGNGIPAVYWFHRPYSDPADGSGGLGGAFNFGATTGTSYQMFTVDLSNPPNSATNQPWNGSIVGLRIDPSLGGSNENAFFDWVRLTAADGAAGAAMQQISWSGGSGSSTITVQDAGGTVLSVATVSSGTTYNWNYGILPPGTYTLRVTRGSASGTTTFRINTPPSVQITAPSVTSGEDYSTAHQSTPWDMKDGSDIDNDVIGNADHLVSRSFSNEFVGVSDGQCVSDCGTAQPTGDPQVYMLANNEANNRGTIDSTKYRYLTFNLQLDRAYNLFLGSVGRVMWGHSATFDLSRGLSPNYNVSVTEPFIVFPGSNRYAIDLASLGINADQGILPAPNSPTPTRWASAPVRQLRIDPHEFAEQLTFHMSDVKLTAIDAPGANGRYVVRFSASDADGDSVSVRLYRDVDTIFGNGNEAEITSSPLTGGATSFDWNPSGTPAGLYYIYAQVSDGIQTKGAYSDAPINTGATTMAPPEPHLALDAPTNGSTIGTSFAVSGWALDKGAASGTGIDLVAVYAFPTSGAPSTFLGFATLGGSRPDIGGVFGSQFTNSGFTLNVVGTIGDGTYQITALGHSTVASDYTVSSSAVVTVTAAASRPVMSLDAPNSNSTVGRNVSIAGWAIDQGASSGTGVDGVVVWAYGSNGAAQLLGSTTYGVARPDIGGALGSQFTNSGFRMTATITPPDTYSIVAFAHSTVAVAYNNAVTAANVAVQATNSNATIFVDTPGQNTTRARPFTLSGWAVDQGATAGTGIDAIALWAFPTNGAPATLVGLATYGLSRPDIGSLLADSRFTNSGYSMTVNSSNLPAAGSYDLIVFGRSTVTGSFTAARVVRVTVQ